MPATEPSTALAWSQDDSSEDVLPYSDVTDSRPEVHFRHEEWQDDEPPRRGPLVLFGLSAVAAAIATCGVRHHIGQRHHHDPGRCGNSRVNRSRACGVGPSPSTPGAAGPPSLHRCRATARATVLSGAAAVAGAGDAATAHHDASDYDTTNDDAPNDDAPTDDAPNAADVRRRSTRAPAAEGPGRAPARHRSTRARAAEPAPAPRPSTPAPEARAPALAARERAPRPLPKRS